MAIGHGERRAIDEMERGDAGRPRERRMAKGGRLVNDTDRVEVQPLGSREQLLWRDRALQEVIPGRDGRERTAEGDVRADRAVRLPQRGAVVRLAPVGPDRPVWERALLAAPARRPCAYASRLMLTNICSIPQMGCACKRTRPPRSHCHRSVMQCDRARVRTTRAHAERMCENSGAWHMVKR